jgi:hypothetical protein
MIAREILGGNKLLKAIQLSYFIACAACASAESPLPTDKVQDAKAAMAIAQRVCDVKSSQHDGWTAELKERGWHVIQKGVRSSCPVRTVEVSAADASAEECRICIAD